MSAITTWEVGMEEQQVRRREVVREQYPLAFRRYVLHEHRRVENAILAIPEEYRQLQLHATTREGWEGIHAPFSAAFEKYLDRGIKDLRREQSGEDQRARYVRVEGLIFRLDQRNERLGVVLRYYQDPAWARKHDERTMAGNYGLTRQGLHSQLNRAVSVLWWLSGGAW